MGDDPSQYDAVFPHSAKPEIENSAMSKALQRLFDAVAPCRRRRPSIPLAEVDESEFMPETHAGGVVSAETEVPSALLVQQIESLPAHVQAHLFGFSNIQGASTLGTACTQLNQGIWEDAEVWHAMMVAEQSDVGVVPPQKSAQTLRDDLRWRRYGIDALCGWRKRPPSAQHATALKAAHRAIQGLLPGDGSRSIDAIASAMTDLLRWYDATDDAAHENARALVRAAAARKEVFTGEHIRELRRALEDSKVLRESLTTVPCTMTMDGPAPFAVLFDGDPASSPFFFDDGGSSSDGDCSPSSSRSSIFGSATTRPRHSEGDASPKVAKRSNSLFSSASNSPEVSSLAPFSCLDDDDAAMDRVINALRDTTVVSQ
jgi:hypothetical protein